MVGISSPETQNPRSKINTLSLDWKCSRIPHHSWMVTGPSLIAKFGEAEKMDRVWVDPQEIVFLLGWFLLVQI